MNIYIAPIRGITTYVFRNAFYKNIGGADFAITPFIPTTSGRRISNSHLSEILPENNENRECLIPQFIGNRSEDFVEYSKKAKSLGYGEVNWNLGCPAPMIIRKNRGSALISNPNYIREFLKYYFDNCETNLSVKVRLGLKSPDEIFSLINVLNSFPIKSVTIHPRTAEQMYGGNVDMKRYGSALELLDAPVIFSGDIYTVSDYQSLIDRFPQTSGVMLGRGLILNPFLALLIKGAEIPSIEVLEILKKFHDDIYEGYRKILFGPVPLLGRMKELWGYMANYFDESAKILKLIRKASTLQKYEIAVASIWDNG